MPDNRRCNMWRLADYDGDGNWIFADAGDMSGQQLAAHTTSPTTVDFDNDGIPEIILGCEDGFLYHLKNNDWKKP